VALAALASTQGAASVRGGGAVAQAAYLAARDPRICALAVPLEWHNYVISAYLRRNLPLYAVPEGVLQGRVAIPPDIRLAANAMLAERAPAPGWSEARCVTREGEKACLYLRPGSCDPTKARDSERQTYMVANDL
jgi:GPI mannosyltransferase 3